jgi:Soluble NSF attachment protein, SNAP
MPSTSPAQTLLERADKKAGSSTGWFSSSSTKFEEAGDLYQQAANAFKLDKLFREAGDAFSKEAECREKCKETNDAANAWWNSAKAYKRGYPDRLLIAYASHYIAESSLSFSRNPSIVTNYRSSYSSRSLPSGC